MLPPTQYSLRGCGITANSYCEAAGFEKSRRTFFIRVYSTRDAANSCCETEGFKSCGSTGDTWLGLGRVNLVCVATERSLLTQITRC
jgi:hypothetical protein